MDGAGKQAEHENEVNRTIRRPARLVGVGVMSIRTSEPVRRSDEQGFSGQARRGSVAWADAPAIIGSVSDIMT